MPYVNRTSNNLRVFNLDSTWIHPRLFGATNKARMTYHSRAPEFSLCSCCSLPCVLCTILWTISCLLGPFPYGKCS